MKRREQTSCSRRFSFLGTIHALDSYVVNHSQYKRIAFHVLGMTIAIEILKTGDVS